MDQVDTVVAIETPERVIFAHRLAGPAHRALAWGLDLCAQVGLGAGVAGVALALGWGMGSLGPGVAAAVGLVGMFALQWLYGAFFEGWWRGRTPGKLAVGLRVVREHGGPIGWREAWLRNLMRGADALPGPYTVGLVAMAIDPRMRRLGDLVAGTMVVIESKVPPPALERWPDPPTDEERASLPSRVRLTPREREVLASLWARSSTLGPARVAELAAPWAEHLTARTGVRGEDAARTLALCWWADRDLEGSE